MFEDLLKREFARNEKKEFLTIFSKTVSDDLKELIYRLDLVIGGFTDHEIKLVSNIKPRIEKPFEKLNPVFQIWVRSSGNRYNLSPILKGMGEKNLVPDTSKEIYLALAEDIINRRHLNHIEVTHVILYFISAKDYNNAAIMLMNALLALLEVKAEKIDDYGIASVWANKLLPEEIELNLRLTIRVLQLKTHEKLNKDVSFILNDLDRLVSDAGEKEMLGLVAVTFHFVTSETIKKLSTFYKYFLKLSKIPGIDSIFPPNISLEKAMWLCTIHIKTGEDLLEWLNAVEMMSVKSRNALFKTDINMLQSSVIMCENIFLWESKKLQENQNWSEVLKILEEVGTRAKKLDLEILWSSAIRTQIIVLAEYMDQFEKAIQLGERSLKIATENPIVQYLLKGIIAKQFLINGDYNTADQWYILAAKQEIESLHILRLFSLLDHSLAVSHLDLKRALKICEKAVFFAEQNTKTLSKDLLVMALGEYTILKFENFGVNVAFEPLEKGFEILRKSKKRKALWKNFYVALGHISGYLYHMAAFGVPPKITASGDPYMPPKPGMLLNHDDKLQSLYEPSKEFVIFCQLSMYAESIGKDEKAFKWGDIAYCAYKKAFTNIDSLITPIIIRIIVPSLIAENKFGSSISLSHEIYLAMCRERSKNNAAKEVYLMPLGEFLIYNNLIPIMLEIARLKILNLINEDEIKNSIDQFRDTHFGKTKINVNLWDSAIKIFEIIFLKKEINQEEIWQNNFTRGERTGIIMLTNLGNSIVDNVLPESAIQFHASVVPNIDMYYKNFHCLYRKIFVSFFKIYWEKKFKENRFRFRTPGLVQENMNKAFASKSAEVIKDIIRVVADGLGVGLFNSDFFQKHA